MDFLPTLPAATVFATTNAGGSPRAPVNGEVLVWSAEVEAKLKSLSPGVTALTGSATVNAATQKPGEMLAVTALSADGTITLPLAKTAGAGYAIGVKRLDTSAFQLTVARAGSDKIDDDWCTSFVMPAAGDWIILVSDGVSKWLVAGCGIKPVTTVVAATDPGFALLPGESFADIEAVASGATGGSVNGITGSNVVGAASGGGGGGEFECRLDVRSLVGQTLSLTVGASPAAPATGNVAGNDGNPTILAWSAGASSVTAAGGIKGLGVDAANADAITVGGLGGDVSTSGSQALVSRFRKRRGRQGGHGLSMAGSGTNTVSGAGADSRFGPGGKSTATGGNGEDGQAPGSAGAGARSTVNDGTNYAGGRGPAGQFILTRWIRRG